jgi:N-acetylmuramoyl-L-alanine amidase
MLPRTHIMLHHSLTPDGQTVSWGAIRRYHVETRGWDAIGYHYGVELVGDHYEVLLGRSELDPAAACPQELMNSRALHVCCVGNFDEAPPPRAMLDVLVGLVILPAMVEYGLPPERIIGHRDANHAKTCPGTQFDLEVVRRMALQSTGTLAGVDRWHRDEAVGTGPLAALRRAAPGGPSREELASRLGWPLHALADLESSSALPNDDHVPEYARALGVAEHQVIEAFTLAAMDYHRQLLAEASGKLGVLHAQSPKGQRRAAA